MYPKYRSATNFVKWSYIAVLLFGHKNKWVTYSSTQFADIFECRFFRYFDDINTYTLHHIIIDFKNLYVIVAIWVFFHGNRTIFERAVACPSCNSFHVFKSDMSNRSGLNVFTQWIYAKDHELFHRKMFDWITIFLYNYILVPKIFKDIGHMKILPNHF